MIPTLKAGFTRHLSAINFDIEPLYVDKLWQNIVSYYSEPVRAYHNLTHLQQLLEQFEQLKSKLKQPSILALALFYHDVIYDPTQQDNELKSAEYAVKDLQNYLSIEQCERIYALIMMTAKHKLNEVADLDAAYLLDMDLSILAADWTSYQHYAQAVRQEYRHVATDDYRNGRTAVLKELLAHDRLYLTKNYYERLEQQARDNIEREIKLLQLSQSITH